VLTGQAKTDYQREYMHNRRLEARNTPVSSVVDEVELVRPKAPPENLTESVRPEQIKIEIPKPQSTNSMRVGYVPPRG